MGKWDCGVLVSWLPAWGTLKLPPAEGGGEQGSFPQRCHQVVPWPNTGRLSHRWAAGLQATSREMTHQDDIISWVSFPGFSGVKPRRTYHPIVSDVTGAVGGGLRDSFIHSTFINIRMRAYNTLMGHKAFVPGPERRRKHFSKMPRSYSLLRLGARAEDGRPGVDNGAALQRRTAPQPTALAQTLPPLRPGAFVSGATSVAFITNCLGV